MSTYTMKRERVTHTQTGHMGKPKITHPMLWVVMEDGEDVKFFDKKGEALEWIASQQEN